jgi:hypothetical protein
VRLSHLTGYGPPVHMADILADAEGVYTLGKLRPGGALQVESN